MIGVLAMGIVLWRLSFLAIDIGYRCGHLNCIGDFIEDMHTTSIALSKQRCNDHWQGP